MFTLELNILSDTKGNLPSDSTIHTNITAVQRRPSSLWRSGIAQLVVNNQMDAPTNSEMW